MINPQTVSILLFLALVLDLLLNAAKIAFVNARYEKLATQTGRKDDKRSLASRLLSRRYRLIFNLQTSHVLLRFLLAGLVIFLVIGVLVVVWQVDRLVLHRLDGYDRLINTIRRTNDLRDYRLKTGKRDELGRLGMAINEMLDALAENQSRLMHDASHDHLTGLPNRRLFMDRLEQTVNHSERRDTRLGIMAIDLDGFKEVNDNFGHTVGDQLLREVSRRLLHSVRRSDTVGRLGGDEFLVMLYHVEDIDSTIAIVQKISHYLAQPYHIGNRDIQISASIGVAIYPDHATHVDELLKRADKLMYRAKHAGKNTFRIAGRENQETLQFCASTAVGE